MVDASAFPDLIRRVRAGDEDAAATLVRQYEPYIRRSVRHRLRDTRLGRLVDSVDICQLVLASFFVRAALGQFELETPEQLVKLLLTMARNKLANEAQRQQADKRDIRRDAAGPAEAEVAAAASSPSKQVLAKELLQETLRRLTPEERRLVELREQGHDWGGVAEQLGGSPEARRKQLARAVERIAQELQLDG